MLEEELGSIVFRCKQVFNVQVYPLNLKQDMAVPSMYFPPPISIGQDFTSHSYQKQHRLSVKVFDTDAQKACKNAEMIADALRANRSTIELVNPDGTPTGRFKRLGSIETRLIDEQDDSATAELAIEWNSRYIYDEQMFEKIMHLYTQIQ